ncbi:GNAT family N-acetyltransferase [Paenibacillus albiflavus]|nr:GNAT family N-acetyltransferase [Paenibacillus albiflavus]
MSIEVRFGRLEDLEDVINGDQSVADHILKWKLENQEIILAEENKELVGYLRLEYLWSKYPYIGLIIVNPEYRGRGIGKRMLEYSQDYLTSKGLKSLYSSSQVNESEPQKWHRKMGFEECGILNGINSGNIGELFYVKKI